MSILLLLFCALAGADERGRAREHYSAAHKAFDLGLYDKAIAEFMEAYQIVDDPSILYNLALAHRLAGHAPEALRFYRMYLVKSPHAPNRDEVASKIEELKKTVEQQQKTRTMPPDHTMPGAPPLEGAVAHAAAPAPRPPVAAARPVAPAPRPSTPSLTHPAARAGERPGRAWQIAGLTVGAVGVAALAAGIGLQVTAGQKSDELSALNGSGKPYDPSLYAAGRLDQTLAGVAFGVGAAALVTGVVVYVLGHRRAASLTPMVSARGAVLRF